MQNCYPNVLHYTMPAGMFGGCCPVQNTGYAPGDPRSAEPTAQNLSVGSTTSATVSNGNALTMVNTYTVSGAHITPGNPISLRPGHKYLIGYTAIGKPAASGDAFGAKLKLNGVDVPGSAAAIAGTAADLCVTGGTIVSTIGLSATATLNMAAIAATTATYSWYSMWIVEVE